MNKNLEAKKLAELIAAIHANPGPVDDRSGNAFEYEFAKEIHDLSGGIAVKNGWPDFGVYGKDGCFKAAVEAKPESADWSHPQQKHQLTTLIGLAAKRVPSFIRCGSLLVQIDEKGRADQVERDVLIRLLL